MDDNDDLKWDGYYCAEIDGKHILDIDWQGYGPGDPSAVGQSDGWLGATEEGILTGQFYSVADGTPKGSGIYRWEGTQLDGEMVPCDQSLGFVVTDISDDQREEAKKKGLEWAKE